MGLSPAVAEFFFARLVEIHPDAGPTIPLVKQRVAEAPEFADRGYVLEAGRIALEGTHEALLSDDRVRQAYLGM